MEEYMTQNPELQKHDRETPEGARKQQEQDREIMERAGENQEQNQEISEGYREQNSETSEGFPEQPAQHEGIKTMRKTVNRIFFWLLFYNFMNMLVSGVWIFIAPDTDLYLVSVVATLACAGIVYLCTHRKLPVNPFRGSGRKMTGRDFVLVFGAFCITQILTLLVTLITEALGIEGTQIDMGPMTAWLMIYAALTGPLAEELIYRGFAAGGGRRLGRIPAIVLASLAFGLMHGNLSQFIIGMLGGLVLGYVFTEYSIWWSLLIHIINNSIGVISMSVPPEYADAVGIAGYAVFVVFAVCAVVQLVKRRGEIKAWFADPANHGQKGVVRSTLTSPWFIIFTLIYAAAIILLMIFPEALGAMSQLSA